MAPYIYLMTRKKSLLEIIKSDDFALWIAILSVIVQSFHSYTAFHDASTLKDTTLGISQAILFAVVIDLAILFYTLRNRKDIALGAAGVMFLINAYYYYQHFGISFQFAFGCFLAAIIPASVYFYSEEIQPEEKSPVAHELEAVEKDRDMWKAQVESLRETNKILAAESQKHLRALEHSEANAANLKKALDEIKLDRSLVNVQDVEQVNIPTEKPMGIVNTSRPYHDDAGRLI